MVELVREVRSRLSGWYDEHEVAEAAIAGLGEGSTGGLDRLAKIIVHLPVGLGPVDRRLVTALAARFDVSLLLGLTGDREADEATDELAERLAPGGPGLAAAPAQLPVGTEVVSAPSADTEVLLAVRGVMQRLRDGVPLERMAVVHGGADPYPRLVHESFLLAGIPTNSAGVRPLSATMVGRTLLGALALPDHEWRREEVIAWLAGGPIRSGGAARALRRLGRRLAQGRHHEWARRVDRAPRAPRVGARRAARHARALRRRRSRAAPAPPRARARSQP